MSTHRLALGIAPLALAILVAACSAAPTDSPRPSSPPPTHDPSPAPSESPRPTADPTPDPTAEPLAFVLPALARVQVDGLRVRRAPSPAAEQLVEPEVGPITLDAGDLVLVIDGPVEAGGLLWYAVGLDADPALYARPLQVGWISGGTRADPWLAGDASICPGQRPTVAELAALSNIARYGCYGQQQVELEAHVAALAPDAGLGGHCAVTDPGLPAWLLCDHVNYAWINADGGTDWLVLLHFDPAEGIEPIELAPVGTTGPAVRVLGHFGTDAAADCVVSEAGSVEAMAQELTCATRFVVRSLEMR